MNCKNCGAKLSSISKFCPDCGAKIDLSEAPKQNSDTSTIEGVMSNLVNQFGKDVYKKDNATKLKNLLCDLAVKFPRELKLLTRVVPEGLQEILLNADNGSEDEKQSAVIAFQKQLVENAFLSDQVAAEAANILTVGLGWKTKLMGNTTQPIVQTAKQNIVQNTKSVPANNTTKSNQKFDTGDYSFGYLWGLWKSSPENLLALESETHKAEVQNFIGHCYYDEGKKEEAVYWWTKASEQGLANAQSVLGSMYEKGEGVPQNYEKAFELRQKAFEQGHIYAACNLGRMYEEGYGVQQNYEKAAELYQKGVELGHDKAMIKLGEMYESGKGVPQNYEKACELYQMAADKGSSKAIDKLEKLKIKI